MNHTQGLFVRVPLLEVLACGEDESLVVVQVSWVGRTLSDFQQQSQTITTAAVTQ